MSLVSARPRSRRLLVGAAAAAMCSALVLSSTPSVASPGKPDHPQHGSHQKHGDHKKHGGHKKHGHHKKHDSTVPVRLIGFNDLHGNLEPPSGSSGSVTLADGSAVEAGGAAFLAAHADRLQDQVRHSAVVSAGDAIGASPVISALFRDEPTIEVLNEMGLEAMAVGNHEFDEGYRELLRIQKGGCHPTDGCQFSKRYRGAKFPILGANVTFKRSGLPALLPFTVLREGGVNVGVIGVTLKGVPDIVSQAGISNLEFGDEVRAINRTSRLLERFGVRAQVVLMHQGDDVTTTAGGPNACNVEQGGPAGQVVAAATPQVDAFMLGHSHQAYNCSVADPAGDPRPVIQGLSFGRLLSVVDLKVDRRTRDVVRSRSTAQNVVVTRTVTPDRGVQSIIDRAKELSAPLANQEVGSISADITRGATRAQESALGNLIADSQLASTEANGAQLALMNPGGVRADLTFATSPVGEGDGVVTYGEAFTVQPFGNILQTLSYTGAQLQAVLEQQFEVNLLLQTSDTLRYSYSASAPVGSKVSDVTVAGEPLDPAATYRVTVNNFLAGGGDGFTTLTEGTDVQGGEIDLDAFIAYLGANPGIAPPALDRVTELP